MNAAFLAQDRWERVRTLQWKLFEQYCHEPYIATAHHIKKYLGLPKDREAEYYGKQAGGHKALTIMNNQLAQQTFLVEKTPSIADIARYAYTQVADEGGLSPNILRWFNDIEHIPGYVSMSSTKE